MFNKETNPKPSINSDNKNLNVVDHSESVNT